MGSTTDFLFNGSAPPSTTSYGSSVTNIPTWLSDYTQGLVAKANEVGVEPYQQYGEQRYASFSPDTLGSFDMVRQNVGAYAPAIDSAITSTAATPGNANPWFNAAGGNLNSATDLTRGAVQPGMGALSAAAPWAGAASNTFTGRNVQDYMNPFVDNVTNRAASLAMRNFNENVMPSLRNEFVSSGQFGSDRNMDFAGRAGRDVTQNIQDNANATLANAYTAGQGAFNNDMSRFAGLASTMGGFGGQQQNALLQAGQQLGQIGAQYGSTGTQQGQLGLDAAKQQGALAQAAQQMGITDSAQLNAIGQQQQDQAQKNLDYGYQNWQNEVNYPRSTLDWMSQIIRGLPASSTTSGSNTGPGNNFQPSPLSQLGSLATGLTGLNKLTQEQGGMAVRARGGVVYKARGGLASVKPPANKLGQLVGGRSNRRALGVL